MQQLCDEALPPWDTSKALRPRISIVIPVRNRGATLSATLETCTTQAFADFEVIVSDNQSHDNTIAVVEGCADPRVRLVKTPASLAMTDNFEFALRHARGDYILFIGGDDGLYPWSLAYLNAMITALPSECYDWDPPHFIWPHQKKALLYCDISPHLGITWRETAEEAEARLAKPTRITQPLLTGFNIYHGCVSRALIAKVIAAQGRYFEGPSPDLSASLDNLLHAEGTVHLGSPVSIAGMSQSSTGWAFTAPKPTSEQSVIRAEFLSSVAKLDESAIPINVVSTNVAPYLGAVVRYWFKKYGDLNTFPHKPWRALYADQLMAHYHDNLAEHCIAYGDFVAFLQANGAGDAEPLDVNDMPSPLPCELDKPAQQPLPNWALDFARDMRVLEGQARFEMLKLFQWENALMAEVESYDHMLSVADHAALIGILLPVSGEMLASLDDKGREQLTWASKVRAAAMTHGES